MITAVLALSWTSLPGVGQDVLTYHNDSARSGVQQSETVLVPSLINYPSFGKVLTFLVDGDVYAQPLYVSKYTMSDGRQHNVLIVATQHDWVYTFDADGNNPPVGYLWRTSLLGSGETWISWNDVGTEDIKPDIGIVGTPVIDRTGGTIYAIAKSKTASGGSVFTQRLHALNLANGAEKLNGPTNVQATLAGTGQGQSTVSFDPLLNNQRPALLLAPTPNGKSASSVFIAWASHGDKGAYHGWVISYNAADIAEQTGAWVDTPNGSQGGIWMGAGGLSTDGNGHVYGASGNGTFDAKSGGSDYGDTLFKLDASASSLNVTDYFTPTNQASLDGADQDFGVGGAPLIFPNPSGPIPDLLLTAAKDGTIFLLNRDVLGHYSGSANSDIQDFKDGGYSIHSNLAFFNNALYLAPDGGPVESWAFTPSTGQFNPTPQSKSTHMFGCNQCDGSGSNFTISANGKENGIVWAIDYSKYGSGPAALYAYDAINLSQELYDSSQAANNRDQAPVAVKFASPTVANGRVYVGGRNAVVAYGLFNTVGQPASAPSFSPAGGTYSSSQNVTISDSTPGPTIYYTTDGSTPTNSSRIYSSPVTISTTTILKAIATAPGYVTSSVSTATYTIYSGEPPTAAPSFSPAGGTYSSSQTVTISDSTVGAKVYYTTNGSSPTSSSLVYSSPLMVSTNTTLKAIAIAAGHTTSALSTAIYTIGSVGGGKPNYPQGFTNAGLTLNGGAALRGSKLRLTDGGSGEARSAFFSTPVNVQEFTTRFTFQLTKPDGDGFTFVIQGDGPTALGLKGGGLGYGSDHPGGPQGIPKSVAVKFDLYNNAGESQDSTGIYTNGASPTVPAIDLTKTGVNLKSGDVFSAKFTYSITTLTVVITDTSTRATATQTYSVNIPSVVGGNTAYVGFTGGTGGSTATQDIQTWTYTN